MSKMFLIEYCASRPLLFGSDGASNKQTIKKAQNSVSGPADMIRSDVSVATIPFTHHLFLFLLFSSRRPSRFRPLSILHIMSNWLSNILLPPSSLRAAPFRWPHPFSSSSHYSFSSVLLPALHILRNLRSQIPPHACMPHTAHARRSLFLSVKSPNSTPHTTPLSKQWII
jgi:hypothetical protein